MTDDKPDGAQGFPPICFGKWKYDDCWHCLECSFEFECQLKSEDDRKEDLRKEIKYFTSPGHPDTKKWELVIIDDVILNENEENG